MKIFFCPCNWQLIIIRVWTSSPYYDPLLTWPQWHVYNCPLYHDFRGDTMWTTKRCCVIKKERRLNCKYLKMFSMNQWTIKLIHRIPTSQRIHKIMNFTQLLSFYTFRNTKNTVRRIPPPPESGLASMAIIHTPHYRHHPTHHVYECPRRRK